MTPRFLRRGVVTRPAAASSHTDLYERMFGTAVDIDLVGRKAGGEEEACQFGDQEFLAPHT